MIDSVPRTSNNYYPQVFLEECKYIVKGMSKSFIGDIETSDEENTDEKNSAEENFDEENLKNTCIVKLFLKRIKETDKIIFYFFFSIYKNDK